MQSTIEVWVGLNSYGRIVHIFSDENEVQDWEDHDLEIAEIGITTMSIVHYTRCYQAD